VLIWRDEVALIKNDEGEWELPGGLLQSGESPEECVECELEDEWGLLAKAERLLATWVTDNGEFGPELIIAYGCSVDVPDPVALSDAYSELRFFPINEIRSLPLGAGYADAIHSWHRLLGR
jgi:ADP-ribose pyrophosphatase YjhB (NUDIX family)